MGMRTLLEDGMNKAVRGTTTLGKRCSAPATASTSKGGPFSRDAERAWVAQRAPLRVAQLVRVTRIPFGSRLNESGQFTTSRIR